MAATWTLISIVGAFSLGGLVLMFSFVARVETNLGGQMAHLEQRIDARIDGVESTLSGSIGRVEQRIDAQTARIDHLSEVVTAHLREHPAPA
jgi:hypothetical protein